MNILNESQDIKKVNEMFVDVQPSLSSDITNSIFYNKLKYFMFKEIVDFCKEKIELKNDLLELRVLIGEFLTEQDIRNKLDLLKERYNNTVQNIGIEYHLESTRIDYGVAVFCIIKRDDIYAKKFVFRFRKSPQIGLNYSGLSSIGAPISSDLTDDEKKEIRKDKYKKIVGDDK